MIKIRLSGIYKITIGEYYYIGKSLSIYDRWQGHYTKLKQGTHHSPELQSKYNELGVTSLTFSILEYVSITDYKKVSQMKGEQLKLQFNRHLLNLEKKWMKLHSINFALNKNNRDFS
jgi:hypothetical protein